MTGMLASVSNLNEALLILKIEVDIIDLKQPERGALGALEPATVRSIVTAVGGHCTLSATVGDLPMQPDILTSAVKQMAATGVDYIKIGFFPGDDWPGSMAALAELAAAGLPLIAVLFADTRPDFTILPTLSQSGFKGVMVDTMDKQKGSLTQIMSPSEIQDFVETAVDSQLLCGLAGSLRLDDINPLAAFRPDYLGFRGALCRQADRTAQLDTNAVNAIKTSLRNACRYANETLQVD